MVAEQGRLPESLESFITEYEDSLVRQIEKKVADMLRIAEDALKGEMATPRITTTFKGEEYQLWLKKTEDDGKTKISFEVTPTYPKGSSGDSLYTIENGFLYDTYGDDVEDLDKVKGYHKATQHLGAELLALSGRAN